MPTAPEPDLSTAQQRAVLQSGSVKLLIRFRLDPRKRRLFDLLHCELLNVFRNKFVCVLRGACFSQFVVNDPCAISPFLFCSH